MSIINKYQEKGYKDREDYLKAVAVKYNCHIDTVLFLAEAFGEGEDFDGLIISLRPEKAGEVKRWKRNEYY